MDTYVRHLLSASLICMLAGWLPATAFADAAAKAGNSTLAVSPVIPLGPALGPVYQASVSLPPLSDSDLASLRERRITGNGRRVQIGARRGFEQSVAADSNGTRFPGWLTLPDGWSIWSVEIRSQGALGLRAHLESIDLPKGARIIVYDPANPMPDEEPVTAENLGHRRETWSRTVFAERMVIECQCPSDSIPQGPCFSVAEVSHIYHLPRVKMGREATCHADVSCYPDWAAEASAVARMSFVDAGNTYLCTSCLLDGSGGGDYILTASHCLRSQKQASTIELFWFYQTSSCDGVPPDLQTVPRTSGGADLLATSSANDFAFLRLRRAPPPGVARLKWSLQPPAPGELLACIHHPGNSHKRIALGSTIDSDANFWGVQWYAGITEEGSSGAPLLNSRGEVIGHLNGGFYGPGSSCDDPSSPDGFGRFDVTYAKVSRWLAGKSAGGAGTSFEYVQGTYSGLFQAPDGIDLATSGAFTLKVTSKGSFSGQLQSRAARYSFSGQFTPDGSAVANARAGRFAPLVIHLQLDLTEGTDQVTGSVSGDSWMANLSADRAVFGGRASASPFAGQYNLTFAGAGDPEDGPQGASFAAVTIDSAGKVRLSGVLADGTKLTQAAQVSKNGDWPLYVPLYGGQGGLFSWLAVAPDSESPLAGDIAWIKLPTPRTRNYPAGFAVNSSLSGSRYVRPGAGGNPLGLTEGQVQLAGGFIDPPIVSDFGVGKGNRIVDNSGNQLKLSFTPTTGLFRGSIRDPSSGKPVPFQGAVLQNQNAGYGFFLNGNQSGTVYVGP